MDGWLAMRLASLANAVSAHNKARLASGNRPRFIEHSPNLCFVMDWKSGKGIRRRGRLFASLRTAEMAIYKLIYDQESDPPATQVVGDFLNAEAALAALNASRTESRFGGKKFRFYEDDVEVTGWSLISAVGETCQLMVT